MILHHYSMSPFSEKIRLMFGYTGLEWQSLPSPEMPPRPGLDPLTGGYRRIPVAQIGADIYCDTRLIADEIAGLANNPALSPQSADADTRACLDRWEGPIFWACIFSIPARLILTQLVRNIGFRGALRFLRDRIGVGRQAQIEIPSPKQAAPQFRAHIEELEQRLGDRFLLGDQPGIADFCAYHTLWFQREVGGLPAPEGVPAVAAWYLRMEGIGHGKHREISPSEAFAVARDSEPRPVDDDSTHDPDIGASVTIAPDDYALDAVRGTLVGCSRDRYILARDTEEFGCLHVHFPRRGFALTRE